MTEKGKKPGADASGESDPLSATGMFLNAFAPQPEPPVERSQEGPPKRSPNPAEPGEFTKMFHQLEIPPAPPLPQARSSNTPPQEPGEFTRVFVAAATSPGLRPAPNTPDAAPFAPPAPPRMRGFSTPGTSDSASAEGSFTQLFRTPSSPPAPSPLQSFPPLPSAPPQATEPAWPQSLDPVPNGDRMAPGGLTQLFRSLSDESEPPPNRIGESPLVGHAASPVQPLAAAPASVTGLIRRLTEDQQHSAPPAPPTPLAAAPEGLSGPPGEFTRIMTGGAANPASAPGPGVAAGNFATPVPPTLVFPAAPAPAFAAPPGPAFAAPPVPVFAAPPVPALAVPPAQPPKPAPSAVPQQTKLQQMLPMLLVLNAFLVVVLILLLVFALKSR
jgi:hypothetical protein